MIYEIAQLPVRKEKIEPFRRAFAEVAPLLIRAEGYRGHFLTQGIETPELFHLIVRLRSLEDHTPGFEASEDHRIFMMGLQEYFRKNHRSIILGGQLLLPANILFKSLQKPIRVLSECGPIDFEAPANFRKNLQRPSLSMGVPPFATQLSGNEDYRVMN